MTEMSEINKMKEEIVKLKSEKRTLIGQYNKEKTLRESFEKELKELKKHLKRSNRKTKKSISIGTDATIGTQTKSISMKSISIQTDDTTSNETYYQCRKIAEDLVHKSLSREQGIQCNFINDQDPDEKNILVRNSKMNDEFYLMKHFKNPKYKTTKVAYINENYVMRFRREMLGVLDMDEDFRYINIDGKLMQSLMFTFYSADAILFNFNYKVIPNEYKNKKLIIRKDILSISNNRKTFKTIRKQMIPLESQFNLRMTYEKQTRSKEYFRIVNKPGISGKRIRASKKYNKERLPKSMKTQLQEDKIDIINRDVYVYTFWLNNEKIFQHELDRDLPIKIMQSNANFDFNFE